MSDCYTALELILDDRKRTLEDRVTRDEILIERGAWVGLQRALEVGKVNTHYGSDGSGKASKYAAPSLREATMCIYVLPEHLLLCRNTACPHHNARSWIEANRSSSNVILFRCLVLFMQKHVGNAQTDGLTMYYLVVPTTSTDERVAINIAGRQWRFFHIQEPPEAPQKGGHHECRVESRQRDG